MSENIHLNVESVANLQGEEAMARIGRLLDDFAELAPDRKGPRDPPRTRVSSVERELRDWAPVICPGDYFNQFMRGRVLPAPTACCG